MIFGRVYGLYDPLTSALRYIGQTVRTCEVRLKTHLNPTNLAKPHRSARWLAALVRMGLRPIIRELRTACSREDLDRFEVECIAEARAAGADLTNHTDGGRGQSGRQCSLESRARMAAAKRGKPGTRTGTKQSVEACQKVSASLRGKYGEASRPFRHDVSTATILRRVSESATRDQIAQELGVGLSLVSKRIAMARRDGLVVTRPKRRLPEMSEAMRGKTGQAAKRYRNDISVETVVSFILKGLSQREVARRLLVCRQLVQSRVIEARRRGML